MPDEFFPPLTKMKPFYPGQWGVPGSDAPLGLRTDTRSTVFYVDSGHPLANDGNVGTDPDNPLATISGPIGALAKATTNANDYIVVRQLTNANETWPITITKNRVHLISTFYRLGHGPELRPNVVTAGLLILADNVEVAGFEINAGDNTVDCITFSTVAATWGADIHHNRFGWQVPARDGINMDGAVDKPHFTIHDNWFNDKLVRDGIHIHQNSCRTQIWNNVFRMPAAGNIGINLLATCNDLFAIHDNNFRVDGAVAGTAITCNAASANCMFYGNRAMFINANPATNPYVDPGHLNGWADNYSGNVLVYPA